ncbi:MAG: DUF1059 domain-containing protein [Myxococcota bacterium]
MAKERYAVDCRESPGSGCSLRITGTQDEVVECAVHHAVTAHGYPNNNDTRAKIRGLMKEDVAEPA